MNDKKTEKKPLVPRLRFPEFRDSGEWEECPLEKAADFVRERIPWSDVTSENYISTENILPEFRGVVTSSSLPTSGTVVSYQKNDILAANIRPYLKKIWLADKNGGASNDVIVIRAKKKINHLFLSHLLINDCFIDYVMSGVKGLKMPRGELSLIREYPTPLPQKDEQKKIAACLSSLDELINSECKNINTLKAHKKGLMQQLFPDKGKTMPTRRFPELQNVGEWHRANLETRIVTIPPPKKIAKSNYQLSGPFPIIDQGQNDIAGWTNDSSALIHPQGPLIVFGDHTCAMKLVRSSFAQGADGIKIFKGIPSIDTVYLYYFLQSNPVTPQAYKRHFSALKIKSISYPEHQEEQQKIADCLSSLDELISEHSRKIELLKLQKKGLMQQLFPEVDEVTA